MSDVMKIVLALSLSGTVLLSLAVGAAAADRAGGGAAARRIAGTSDGSGGGTHSAADTH